MEVWLYKRIDGTEQKTKKYYKRNNENDKSLIDTIFLFRIKYSIGV